MDIGAFRAAFPEFADLSRYPDSQVEFWSSIAEDQVNENRWKKMTSRGVMLYTAHEITIASQNLRTGNIGGTPGQASGPVSSKAVGGVNVSYDSQQGAEKDAGYWNLTIYGKQYIRLARIFGSGVVQL